jgi:hypothetical protein
MTGEAGNYLNAAARLIETAGGMFLLFAIAMEFLETSPVLFSVLLVYLVYCGYILPEIDRRRGASGAAETVPGTGTGRSDRFFQLKTALMLLTITVVSFLFLHLLIIVMHEFSHSFCAYFLGWKPDPWDIIYGSIIGAHWDENVDYSAIFAAGEGPAAAAIAFAGPLSNIMLFFVTVGLMSTKSVKNHRWIYHCTFWTCVITFAMVFEYVFTRSFLQHDDFGNINHGLGISPWSIFIVGTLLGILGLYYIIVYLLPEYHAIVTPHERPLQYVTVSAVCFVIFLFYIGLRITAYPDVPEWWCGVVGIAALFIVSFAASPARRWVQRSVEGCGVQEPSPPRPEPFRS